MLSDVIVKPQQLLIRPGINYEINKHIEIGGGYAYVPTYRYGTYPIRTSFTEHRLFQNLILRHKHHPVWQRNGRVREDNSTLMVMLWSDQPFTNSRK